MDVFGVEEREDVFGEQDSAVDSSVEVEESYSTDSIGDDLDFEVLDSEGVGGVKAMKGEGSGEVPVGVEGEECEGADGTTVEGEEGRERRGDLEGELGRR